MGAMHETVRLSGGIAQQSDGAGTSTYLVVLLIETQTITSLRLHPTRVKKIPHFFTIHPT
jgi:hypothetical protein